MTVSDFAPEESDFRQGPYHKHYYKMLWQSSWVSVRRFARGLFGCIPKLLPNRISLIQFKIIINLHNYSYTSEFPFPSQYL